MSHVATPSFQLKPSLFPSKCCCISVKPQLTVNVKGFISVWHSLSLLCNSFPVFLNGVNFVLPPHVPTLPEACVRQYLEIVCHSSGCEFFIYLMDTVTGQSPKQNFGGSKEMLRLGKSGLRNTSSSTWLIERGWIGAQVLYCDSFLKLLGILYMSVAGY